MTRRGGVHAEVEVRDPTACKVVSASRRAEAVGSVARAAAPGADTVGIEFTAEADADVEGFEEMFRYGDDVVYRFEREAGAEPNCACERIERTGCPVRHLEGSDGAVVLSFVTRDVDALRDVVVDLRGEYDGVSLRRLTRSADPAGEADLVLVDRAALTDRQREVLETAHRMGYFEHPKRANATEVSDALGVNRSTFAEHLAAAQSKLLDAVLDD